MQPFKVWCLFVVMKIIYFIKDLDFDWCISLDPDKTSMMCDDIQSTDARGPFQEVCSSWIVDTSHVTVQGLWGSSR